VGYFGLKLPIVGCFCFSVTHNKSVSLRITHRKLFLLKVTHRKIQKLHSYPKKDVLVLMLPTQKRFAFKVPTENRNCLSTKAGFFEKIPTDERAGSKCQHQHAKNAFCHA